jgi:hypothetical protein
MVRRLASLVAFLLAGGWEASSSLAWGADPGSLACIQAAEEGQAARDRGELLKASEILATCTADACPGLIRRDCTTWLEEVRARTPSIVVVARDAAGRDLLAGNLTVDGATHPLDGSAIELDPGPHLVRVQAADVVEEHVILTAGEKRRVITLGVAEKPAPPPIVRRVTSDEKPHLPAGSFVLGGLGLVGMGTFGVFGVMGMSDVNHLRSVCAPGCQPSDVDAAKTKLLVADIGLGVGVLSLAAATWIAIRGLTTHHEPAAAEVVRALSRGSLIDVVF